MVHIKLPQNSKTYNNKHFFLTHASTGQLNCFHVSLGVCMSTSVTNLGIKGESFLQYLLLETAEAQEAKPAV